MIKRDLLFPLAAAINFFSITGFLILAGLVGKGSLAADIAIVQGAVLAVFLSLSGNARNLILASGDVASEEKSLFYFRLMLMLPAVAAIFLLIGNTVEVSILLITGLVGRKCTEWFAELQLARAEVLGNHDFAIKYIFINSLGYLLVVAAIIIPALGEYFYPFVLIWAILPVVNSIQHVRYISGLKLARLNFAGLLPHMGSTTVIGVSTYLFRVLIVIMAGKSLAGLVFAAYAIGGVLSSLYVYAIGPTLILKMKGGDLKSLYYFSSFCMVLGLLTIASAWTWSLHLAHPIFVYSIGYSLIGGGIMLLAQRHRMQILQLYKRDVFVPDAISNMLLICSIPFAFYLFGRGSISWFFLWSAVLHLIFYASLAIRIKGNSLVEF